MSDDWADVSSYSRGERGVVEPSSWELNTGPLRVVVTRRHGLDGWFAICYALNMSHVPLAAGDSDTFAAKAEAIKVIRERLTMLLGSLPTAPRKKRKAASR